MEQNDAAGLDFGCHPLGNFICFQIFPLQAVPTGNGFKYYLWTIFGRYMPEGGAVIAPPFGMEIRVA
jgi:hypothetical protein